MEETNNQTASPETPIKQQSNQKPKALVATSIIASIVAIAGIATSIYFYLDASNKATDNADLQAKIDLLESKTSTEPTTGDQDGVEITITKNKKLDNQAAQSIVNPYLKNFGYLNNALDYDFSEDVKAEIAYLNVSPTSISDVPKIEEQSVAAFRMDYYTLNEEYKKLFGSTSELAKKDYTPGHSNEFTYDNSSNSFMVNQWYGGGTGAVSFSIVKDAYFNDDNLVVEVYHDSIPICEANDNGGYCAKAEDDYTINSQSSIFQNNASQIPVYKMTFIKDVDNYVLKNIQKQ